MRRRRSAARRVAVPVLALALAVTGCGTTASEDTVGAGPVDLSGGRPADVVRLGYFGNVTHAPALIGVAEGLFAAELGGTELETQVFGAGPAALEALVAGAVDAAYMGPNPAVNGFVRSRGTALRIVAGSTSGGAQLVVRPGVDGVEDLRGGNLATPQLGNTQDVALRTWLADEGLETSRLGSGGDVSITPADGAVTLQLFQDGEIDGAWLPEPWASRLVLQAGGEVLVDERDRWPGGSFTTTHLVVAADFLREHPQTVEALVRGNLAAIDWIAAHGDDARAAVNDEIEAATGKPLPHDVLQRAFTGLELTSDPLAATLQESFDHSVAAGLVDEASLDGIYDLRLLNRVLTSRQEPAVSAAGLGEEQG